MELWDKNEKCSAAVTVNTALFIAHFPSRNGFSLNI